MTVCAYAIHSRAWPPSIMPRTPTCAEKKIKNWKQDDALSCMSDFYHTSRQWNAYKCTRVWHHETVVRVWHNHKCVRQCTTHKCTNHTRTRTSVWHNHMCAKQSNTHKCTNHTHTSVWRNKTQANVSREMMQHTSMKLPLTTTIVLY